MSDPIDTDGELVLSTPLTAIARRDDAPGLRALVGRLYRHLTHVEPCTGARANCTCGLEALVADAVRLGCREPVRVTLAMPAVSLVDHAAAGAFAGGLLGAAINGLIHGAEARKEARDAKKKKSSDGTRKSRAHAADRPADPRRLGSRKGSR